MEVMLQPSETVAKGTIMAELVGTGIFVPYTGSEYPSCILEYDCLTDSSGGVWYDRAFGRWDKPMWRASAFCRGYFRTTDLPNIDAHAVAILGRLVGGTLRNGVLLVR